MISLAAFRFILVGQLTLGAKRRGLRLAGH